MASVGVLSQLSSGHVTACHSLPAAVVAGSGGWRNLRVNTRCEDAAASACAARGGVQQREVMIQVCLTAPTVVGPGVERPLAPIARSRVLRLRRRLSYQKMWTMPAGGGVFQMAMAI